MSKNSRLSIASGNKIVDNLPLLVLIEERIVADMSEKKANTENIIIIHPEDLPLACPMEDMSLWNAHPRVYLPIEKSGQEICPYCSTRYILQSD